MALLTLAEFKTLHGGMDKITEHDRALTMMIKAAEGVVKRRCRWDIEHKTYAWLLDGDDTYVINDLPFPITEVTSLSIDGVAQVVSGVNANITIYADEGIIKCENLLTGGSQNIAINFKGGFATVPEEVKEAVHQITGIFFSKRNRHGVSGFSQDGINYNFDMELPAIIDDLLYDYMLPEKPTQSRESFIYTV